MKNLFSLFAVISLLSVFAWAIEEYEEVVEGTYFNSTSKVILNQDDIKKTKAPNLSTLLQTQANISVSNTNVQPGSIYLRGGDASHVLILVDGLPFYDTSTVQRTININELDINSIRRIEILKGPQSVLYGGQALSGVIKIETLPREISQKYGFTGELGTREYKKASAIGLQPVSDNQVVLGRVQVTTKDNRSPILDSGETYRGKLASGDLAYLRQDDWSFFIKATQIADRNEISDASFVDFKPIDAKDFVADSDIKGASAGISQLSSKIQPKLLVGYQISDRTFIQRPYADQKYGGDLWNVRLETTPASSENFDVLLGASYLKEGFVFRNNGVESSNFFNEQKGLFAKLSTHAKSIAQFEAGVRSEYYNKYDRTESYQLGLTLWDILKFEYATGFKAPSLFQLYSIYGNTALQPERSKSYTISAESKFGEKAFGSFSVFETHFDGLITTQGSGSGLRYYNVSRAITRGLEALYSFEAETRTRYDVTLGYQEPRDIDNGRWLLRRPLQTGSFRITQKFGDTIEAGYEVFGNGERIDRFSATGYGSLPTYFVSNFHIAQSFNEHTAAYIRGNNIFNERYEESRGFHNEGSFWFLGLELKN